MARAVLEQWQSHGDLARKNLDAVDYLAALKTGRKDDGEVDIKAAAVLDPNLPEQAKTLKLEP